MLVVAITISTAIHQANRSNPVTNLVLTFCGYMPTIRTAQSRESWIR
jgi:hypothetical protein